MPQGERVVGQSHAAAGDPAEIVAQIDLVEMGEDLPTRHDVADFAVARVIRMGLDRIGDGCGVADDLRVHADAADFGGKVGVAVIERHAIGGHAMVHDVLPGEHRGARGAAGCGLAPMRGEHHAVSRQGIEMGRARGGVAEDAETVAAPLVDADEEHVFGHGFVPLACRPYPVPEAARREDDA